MVLERLNAGPVAVLPDIAPEVMLLLELLDIELLEFVLFDMASPDVLLPPDIVPESLALPLDIVLLSEVAPGVALLIVLEPFALLSLLIVLEPFALLVSLSLVLLSAFSVVLPELLLFMAGGRVVVVSAPDSGVSDPRLESR